MFKSFQPLVIVARLSILDVCGDPALSITADFINRSNKEKIFEHTLRELIYGIPMIGSQIGNCS